MVAAGERLDAFLDLGVLQARYMLAQCTDEVPDAAGNGGANGEYGDDSWERKPGRGVYRREGSCRYWDKEVEAGNDRDYEHAQVPRAFNERAYILVFSDVVGKEKSGNEYCTHPKSDRKYLEYTPLHTGKCITTSGQVC